MANVIIIEKETKIGDDIRRFLLEANTNNRVRIFENEDLFFNAYLKKIAKTEEPPRISTSKEGQRLSQAQKEDLLAISLAEKPPWDQSAPALQMTIDADDFKILELLPSQTGLGHPTADFVANQELFEQMITEPFKESWSDFKAFLMRHERVKTILCLEDQGSFWMLNLQGLTDEQGTRITLKDMTPLIISQLKEEKIYLDKMKAQASEGAEETELLYTVDLVLFRTNCITTRLEEWIPQTIKSLKEKELWPEEDIAPKFVALKFDDDGNSSEKLELPGVSDLIMLPLDRLIFLQKIDIVLNFPSKIRPKYLFSQDVQMGIEISKRSRVLKISDLGMAIRNPIPLRAGTPAHIYFEFPEEETLLDVHARVAHTEVDPDNEKVYHVYFSFFGPQKANISKIRLFLSQSSTYKPLVVDNPDKFAPPTEDDAFVDRKLVAVIDLDGQSLNHVETVIKENSKEIEVVTDTSYILFAKRYLQSAALESKSQGLSPPAGEDDIFTNPLVWFVDQDENFVSVVEKAIPQDLILGSPAPAYFSLPQAWKKLFSHPETEEVFNEGLQAAKAGRDVSRAMDIIGTDGKLASINVSLTPTNDNTQVRIELTLIENPLAESADTPYRIETLDLLIIDSAFMAEDIDAWVCSIQNDVYLSGRTKTPLPILIMDGSGDSTTLLPLLASGAYGLINKPVDSRTLMYHVALATKAPYTKFDFANIGWSGVSLPAFLARRAVLAELSEFGGCIVLPKAIQPGTFLVLHGGIYSEATASGSLPARFYYTERNPDDKRQILCHFINFGITDAFLKFTRNWIRDRYAAQKASNS